MTPLALPPDISYRDLLLSAADRVREEPWFVAGNWTIEVGDGATWTGLQLSKTNWFNEDGHGIHFETWLDDETMASGVMRFQAHVMHAGMTFPGTDKKAGALSRPVVARHRELIVSWGYHLPANPGMGLLHTRVEFDASGLTEVVLRECGRFALLGDAIDDVLACVLAGKRPPAAPRQPKAAAASAPAAPAAQTEVRWGANILPDWSGGGGFEWTCRGSKGVTVEMQVDSDGAVRVEVGGQAKRNHDALLVGQAFELRAGQLYRASYDVKAVVPRWMTGNIRQAVPPALDCGRFQGRYLTTEWQTITWEFRAARDETQCTIWFALGKVPNTVWLRNVELRPAQT